ncbi:hypothetical protein ACLI1A_02645 [Flavobacterium sp. RHBU_3]|uniref:hypothetical protein n=1 Tax=Flavobacterium sp. RHBU_3 TaxID=3391184 RepID=UPI003984AE8A
MNDKKDLERLFRERFKDFEADPPEYVWENVREALEEKKKRRAVPLWFRYSGIAAGLVLAAFFGWQYLSGVDGVSHDADPAVVTAPKQPMGVGKDTNALDRPAGTIGSGKDKGNISLGNDDAIAGKDNDKGKQSGKGGTGSGTGSADTNSSKNAVYEKYNNAVVSGEGIKAHQGRNQNHNNTQVAPGQGKDGIMGATANENAVAAHNANSKKRGNRNKATQQHNTTAPNGNTINREPFNQNNTAIAQNDKTGRNASDKNSGVNGKNPALNPGNTLTADKSTGSQVFRSNQNAVAQNNSTAGKDANNNNTGNSAESNNTAVIDKNVTIANETALAEATTDTVKTKPENELEKLLREQQEGKDKDKQVAEVSSPKWNVKPQLAPVFYSAMGNGSSIDAQFAGNTKNFDKDLSYGIGVNYAVNNRLSIRTGVNTVNLNYATQGIEFYASLDASTSNVAKGRNANIVVRDKTEGQMGSLTTNSLAKDTYEGSMVQTTGYVEVPMELSYALLNKKFGIQVIGGVSTLFLNENNVSVVSTQGLATSVGEAENLNNVHFSTNLGVGFRYRFFKSFEANFEPTFKYQVNTYSRDATDFKPYFIGLYSGISFSF